MNEFYDVPENTLVEPLEVRVASHHGTVRLRFVYGPDVTDLPTGTFYGTELTPEKARDLAEMLLRQAEAAQQHNE